MARIKKNCVVGSREMAQKRKSRANKRMRICIAVQTVFSSGNSIWRPLKRLVFVQTGIGGCLIENRVLS